IGWCWARGVCPGAITTGRLAARVGVWAWQPVEPPLRDAAGWLVHTAPGLVSHLLLRLAGWLPVALARALRHAVVGLGWLLARWLRIRGRMTRIRSRMRTPAPTPRTACVALWPPKPLRCGSRGRPGAPPGAGRWPWSCGPGPRPGS